MFQSAVLEAEAGAAGLAGATLEGVRATLGNVAAGLDSRFVQAGRALASAYEIVERVVASLEGVIGALDGDVAAAAIADMQATADRLSRLPALQQARQGDLRAIGEATRLLRDEVAQIHRTLSFLRICGLNIKVAAAGAEEFSGFADHMFARLDLGEDQLSGFDGETGRLSAMIADMLGAEQSLSAECVKVIPHVPQRLAQNAQALQQHQADIATLAGRIAVIARDIRGKVAGALGALQIGDITRQRLEHVAEGLTLIDTVLAEHPGLDPRAAATVRAHVVALLAAQTDDTLQEFRREADSLARNLRGIGPDAARLLGLSDNRDNGSADEARQFLQRLEEDIAEVATVTERLRDADAETDRLAVATSQIADELASRLASVRKVQSDVEQMAWNTGLRCRRMGEDGLALAAIAAEVRQFATNLEVVTGRIGQTFDRLGAAAAAVRDRRDDAGGVDAGRALTDSLASIRAGGERMQHSLASLDGDGQAIVSILRESTAHIDCEAEVGSELAAAAQALALSASEANPPGEAGAAVLAEVFTRLAQRYTMVREREIHARYSPDTIVIAEPAPTAAASDDDLFDDALF